MSYKKLTEEDEEEEGLLEEKEDHPIDEEGDTLTPPLNGGLKGPESGSIEEEEHLEPVPGTLPRESKTLRCVRLVLAISSFVLLGCFLAAAIVLIALAPACKSSSPELKWWQSGIIYQCYPKSFQDSDGNGVGDLRGIQARADHFVDIGVTAVWLNPIFPSPDEDNGYDVSDYTAINPLFGTLDDFKALLADLHNRSLRLILDFVPNHTSDQHPWFEESSSSRNNSKRDWYVWADPAPGGGPPNNWISLFGGSAWTLSNITGQYYLHQFSTFQPDLNYRNDGVLAAMANVLRFWLELGVDGFRVDAAQYLLEDPELRNESVNPDFHGPPEDCATNVSSPDCYNYLVHNLTSNYPGIHSIIKSWRRLLDSYSVGSANSSTPARPRFMVGEVYNDVPTVMSYYGSALDEFDFPFNFFLLENTNWTGHAVAGIVSEWLDNMPSGAWPNWVLGNHDNPRIASKVGVGLARALNVLLLTLPGTPTTYYGEEIQMTDVYVPPDQRQDPFGGRDQERTPMQWNTSDNAGFTSGTPWLPVPDNYTEFNVEVEGRDNDSMLTLYETLARIRANNPALQYSGYELVFSTTSVLAYRRYEDSVTEQFLVVVNFLNETTSSGFANDAVSLYDPAVALSSNLNRTGPIDLKAFDLLAGEALVIKGRSEEACH